MPGLASMFTTLNQRILIMLTVFLFLWPKYVGFGPGLNPFTVTILASYFAIIVSIIFVRTGKRYLSLSAWVTLILFILMFAARLFSDLASTTLSASLYFDIRDLAWGGSLFFIAASLARYPSALDDVAKAICYCSIIVASVALAERLFSQSFPFFILTNLPVNVDSQLTSMLTTDKTRDFSFRSQGFFSHPIVLGEVSAAMFPVAIGTYFDGKNNKIISILAILSCIVAAFLSGSRSAQIALIFSIICYILLLIVSSRSRVVWALSLIALPLALLGTSIAYSSVVELAAGRSSTEQQSSAMRDLMWERGWPAVMKSPTIGYGGGNSAEIGGIIARFGGTYTIDDYYLSVLLDAGIVGLAILTLFIFSLVTGSLSGNVPSKERRMRMGYLAGVFAVLAGQKAASITEGMTFIYFYAGLLVASQSYTRGGPRIPITAGDVAGTRA